MDYRKLRLWIYSALVAAGPLVTFYGIADTNEVALWLGLGGTLLGVPAGTTAIANINPPAGRYVAGEGGETVEIEDLDGGGAVEDLLVDDAPGKYGE